MKIRKVLNILMVSVILVLFSINQLVYAEDVEYEEIEEYEIIADEENEIIEDGEEYEIIEDGEEYEIIEDSAEEYETILEETEEENVYNDESIEEETSNSSESSLTTEIPYTGTQETIIIFALSILMINAIIMFYKIKSMKDIK